MRALLTPLALAALCLTACEDGPPGLAKGKAITEKLAGSASPVMARDVLRIADVRFICPVRWDMESMHHYVDRLRSQFGERIPGTKLYNNDLQYALYVVTVKGDRLITLPQEGKIEGECVRGESAVFVQQDDGWSLRGETGDPVR